MYIGWVVPPSQDADSSSPPGLYITFLGSGIPIYKNPSFATSQHPGRGSSNPMYRAYNSHRLRWGMPCIRGFWFARKSWGNHSESTESVHSSPLTSWKSKGATFPPKCHVSLKETIAGSSGGWWWSRIPIYFTTRPAISFGGNVTLGGGQPLRFLWWGMDGLEDYLYFAVLLVEFMVLTWPMAKL